MGKLTVVGLGPGSLDALTNGAREILLAAPEIVVSREHHPLVAWLVSQGRRVVPIQSLLSPAVSPNCDGLSTALLQRVRRDEETVLASPGQPLLDEPLTRSIVAEARREGLAVEVVVGTSYFDAVLATDGGFQLLSEVQVVGAGIWSQNHPNNQSSADRPPGGDPFLGVYRRIDPARPAFFGPLFDDRSLGSVKQWLASDYPSDHRVSIVWFPVDQAHLGVTEVSVAQLAWDSPASAVCLLVPPIDRLADLPSFDTLRYIVARLRAPNGCPWDREQDYASIKKHLIEETYEAVAALDALDFPRFVEEIGDVLLQAVMYGQFGREAGDFTIEDVLRAVNEKLIRRHPHVFGEVTVSNSAEVLRNWEKIKRREKSATVSSFGGVPESAPALMRADAIQSRAARYGWTETAKVTLPADVAAGERERRARYLGDFLFDLVSIARRDKIDPEEALRLATNRFRDALERVLAESRTAGVDFDSLPVDERERRLSDARQVLGHAQDSANP